VAAEASPGSRPARAPRHVFGGEPLDPLSRRLLRTAGGLSVLLLLVLLNAVVNGGDDTLDLNPVATAAERAQNIPGGRFTLYVVYSTPASPTTFTATGSGAYNAKTDRSRATLEMKGPTGTLHVVEITDGDFEYTGGDVVARDLPPGKEWVRTEESGSGGEEASLDPQDALQILGSSGEVEMIGRESINGKMTRRYRGEVQLGDFIDLMRENDQDAAADAYERIEGQTPTGISAESWVDSGSMLRRFRMVMPIPGEPGEPPLTFDMRMDIFDYGAEPAIQLPNPDRVVEGPLDSAAAPSSIS
jgi:hypothetical protein